jgi:hypothetical protein
MLDNTAVILQLGGGIDSGAGAAPFLDASGPYANPPSIFVDLGGTLGTTPGNFVLSIGAGQAAVILLAGGINTFPNNVVTGPSAALQVVYGETSSFAISTISVPLSQPGVASFIVLDAMDTRNFANYFCGALSDLTNPTVIPFGYSLLSTGQYVSAFAVDAGLLTRALVTCVGNPSNTGLFVTFKFQLNGADIPGASITIAADTGAGGGAITFLSSYNDWDFISMVATPSAPLLASVTNITAAIG